MLDACFFSVYNIQFKSPFIHIQFQSPFKHILLFQIQTHSIPNPIQHSAFPLRSPNSPFAISKQPSPIFKFTLCDLQIHPLRSPTLTIHSTYNTKLYKYQTNLYKYHNNPLRSPNSPSPISKFTPSDLQTNPFRSQLH